MYWLYVKALERACQIMLKYLSCPDCIEDSSEYCACLESGKIVQL